MGHLSSGPGVKPGVLPADRYRNEALFSANAMYVAEASVANLAESQPAGLVYSFIPKHLHPTEIVNVIDYMLPANLSATANSKRVVVPVLPTVGTGLNWVVATLNRVATAIC